jgi:UDP-N-acetylmuramoyl-tripeptide--D-alanyl-D-alanine ligase
MISAIPVTALAHACGGRLNRHPLAEAAKIQGLAIDSRLVQSGDLFAALPGERVDGHDFAERAAQQGAAALLVQRELDADCPQIVVEDCQQALASVGRLAREQYDGEKSVACGISRGWQNAGN